MQLTKREKKIKYSVYGAIIIALALLQNVSGLVPSLAGAKCFLLIPGAVLLSVGEDEKTAITENINFALVTNKYDKYVRYSKSSEEYRLVKLSIMFTVERRIQFNEKDTVVLVGLDYTYESYVAFMITLIYKRIGVYLHKILGEDLNRSSELRELIYASWNVDNSD